MANRRRLAIGLVGLLSLTVSLVFSALRFPIPRVHDEFAYLLAADTFAHGRLTNPTPPEWERFEAFQVLLTPTYISKYPPAQGLVLALGQRCFGAPIVGAWLSFAAGAMATCWMLQGWTRPRWALLGGLLVAFQPAMQGGIDPTASRYSWSQSYWGGGVAFVAGAFVLGALPRLIRETKVRDSLLFGAGLAMLAASRPVEGALLGLFCVGALARSWFLTNINAGTGTTMRPQIGRLLPGVFVLAAGLVGLATYNRAVTGSPLRMPYALYESQYDPVPVFTAFGRPGPAPAYHHAEFRRFFLEWCHDLWARQQTLHGWAAFHRERLGWLWAFYVGVLVMPVAAVPLAMIRRGAEGRKVRFAAAVVAAPVGLHLLSMGIHPHYLAPAAPALMYLIVEGIRHLRTWRIGTIPLGRWLFALTLLGFVLKFGMVVQARATAPQGWEYDRARIDAELREAGGRHLLIVRYAPEHDVHDDWVYNAADLPNAPVIWARDGDAASNQRLRRAFPDREFWVVEPDQNPVRLTPYRDP